MSTTAIRASFLKVNIVVWWRFQQALQGDCDLDMDSIVHLFLVRLHHRQVLEVHLDRQHLIKCVKNIENYSKP